MKLLKKEGKSAIYISAISIQELFEGKSTADSGKLQYLLSVLAPISILEYDTKIAELGGKIARDLDRPLGFANAAIAASSIYYNCSLFTLNSKHFEGIPELELYSL